MRDPVERADVIDALGWGNEWDVMGYTFIDKDDAIRQIKTVKSAEQVIMVMPSPQKPLKYTGESICVYCQTVNCDGCMYEPMKEVERNG